MNNKNEDFEEMLKGVDAALRRAAIKAKEEAERLGTPYVVVDSNTKSQLQQYETVDNKQ